MLVIRQQMFDGSMTLLEIANKTNKTLAEVKEYAAKHNIKNGEVKRSGANEQKTFNPKVPSGFFNNPFDI